VQRGDSGFSEPQVARRAAPDEKQTGGECAEGESAAIVCQLKAGDRVMGQDGG
jgi:hypothetical protein